jgi:hypothetical protein
MGGCSEGGRRCMGVYKSQGVPDSEAVPLVDRNIPKGAIPRMDIVYGKYGSNTIIKLTKNQEILPL